MQNDIYRKGIVVLITVGVLGLALIFFHLNPQKINLSGMSFSKTKKPASSNANVILSVISNINTDQFLVLEIAIPVRNEQQRKDVNNKINRVKSDFLIQIDPVQMSRWVEQRNFRAIKKTLLSIVNRHLETPVNDIYFESFIGL